MYVIVWHLALIRSAGQNTRGASSGVNFGYDIQLWFDDLQVRKGWGFEGAGTCWSRFGGKWS